MLLFPISIVEVVIDPHESLVNYFWDNRFAEVVRTGGRNLNLEASAQPREVELLVC